jgi:acetyl-CoA decarbonylase/synthase complex subunit delta
MAFEIPKETNPGRVVEVTLGATSEHGGTRSHILTIGGSNALPLHFFEGKHPYPPVVAMEVFDKVPSKYPEPLLDYYREVIERPGDPS